MKKYIVILFAFTLLSCQFNRTTNSSEGTDTILHYYSGYYKKKISASLNLNNLENSSDSLEIRIWSKAGVKRFGQLIIIKKNYIGWNCFVYLYLEKLNIDPFEIQIDTFSVEKRVPKSGWPIFLNEINKYKIYDLPNQEDIKGWKDKEISDGTNYAVEFIKHGKYKIYHYHSPDLYLEYSNSKQMVELLSLLKQEINFNEHDMPASLQLLIFQNKE